MLFRRNRNFRLLFTATAVSNLGDGISALAFPWLATLITRDPFLIACVAAATRMPWLLISLPAGVVTDRIDRQTLMVRADLIRMVLTFGVVALILTAPPLPLTDNAPQAIWAIAGLCAAAFALGTAEVFRDNAAQTILPSIVDRKDLETANGHIWSVEEVMGSFIGPPVAGLLIAWAVPAPFVVDALSFGAAAWLVWAMTLPARSAPKAPRRPFRTELAEGLRWMLSHRLILSLGLALGLLNFVTMMSATMLVLLSQEIFDLNAAQHGMILAAGAVGGILGSQTAPFVVQLLGPTRTLWASFALFPLPFAILATTGSAVMAGLAMFLELFAGMTWNVVTVSLRQRLIPDDLLGRVNSVYRFLGWGTIPLGALAAGALVSVFEPSLGRDVALRLPYWVGLAATLGLLIWGLLRLRLPDTPKA